MAGEAILGLEPPTLTLKTADRLAPPPSQITTTDEQPALQPETRRNGSAPNRRSLGTTTLVAAILYDDDAQGVLGWQKRALCAQTDPEAFFPEKGGSTREAKKVCLSCDVRSECLEYALANDERFGIWGGLSERERRRLKKRVL